MSYSDLEAELASVSGVVATVTVHNPQGSSETARITITVSLVSGGSQTITSLPFTIAAGATKNIAMVAVSPIDTIDDGPTPISG